MAKSTRVSLNADELRFVAVAIELAYGNEGFPRDNLDEIATYISLRGKIERSREVLAHVIMESA